MEQKSFHEEFSFSEDFHFSIKMTNTRQKRKAAAELASGEFEASVIENRRLTNLVPGPSKSPKSRAEKLEEI